jgi:methionyl-tRNA synthetase
MNRTLKFTEKQFGPAIPAGGERGAPEARLVEQLEQRIAAYTQHLEDMQFRKAAAELRATWVLGNEYLAEGAPWTSIKTNKDAAAQCVRTAINLIRVFAALSSPVIPFAAEKMAQALNLDPKTLRWPRSIAEELETLKPGHAFVPPATGDVLFGKIAPEQVTAWEERFGASGA